MILRLMINITFSMILFAWFDYHILCVFSATQIRKDAVPDLFQSDFGLHDKAELGFYAGAIQEFFEPWTMSLPCEPGRLCLRLQMPVAARFHMRD
ncbi:hypothetical protein BU813_29775 (plasmid) [Klebsiella pneumoniae subsp. pneumoniae]|uniref:Uncharacterized protein n=6 Tax=Klebsiella pneumoniae TaxID=573 RepID=A0A8F7KQI7_KLEPN|nr:hypothetical protein CES89_28605 [Klebsiella pneumoniae]AUX54507.1 hypothetical protein BU195_27950 [Klebsiella pneumoniae subsp. pneumoniae]KTH78648.1 hypothetical protein ASV18_24970 [Klebsiella aerogenes]AUX54614.1 hypothetical protein BU195_28595 [Klebsiella pneumoniae subsp. pneumoniae]AUX60258.1 hypothetical protein BU813_29775 [Klebsiella pneumoniae subsp. pneumoniae]